MGEREEEGRRVGEKKVGEKKCEKARDGPIRGKEAQKIFGGDEVKDFRRIEVGPMTEEEPRDTNGDGTREVARKGREKRGWDPMGIAETG